MCSDTCWSRPHNPNPLPQQKKNGKISGFPKGEFLINSHPSALTLSNCLKISSIRMEAACCEFRHMSSPKFHKPLKCNEISSNYSQVFVTQKSPRTNCTNQHPAAALGDPSASSIHKRRPKRLSTECAHGDAWMGSWKNMLYQVSKNYPYGILIWNIWSHNCYNGILI